MEKKQAFIDKIQSSYKPKGAHIFLGAGLLDGEIVADAAVNLPLKMMNRHGLIAGATGTGKTRTLQLIAEQLSDAGVPVFLLDVKGDLSGLNQAGEAMPALIERGEAIRWPFEPAAFPISLFSLTGQLGHPMRLTVEDFGPIFLARILELNDTQTGVLAALFKYADDQNWPLVGFDDLKKLLMYLTEGPGAAEIKETYGRISSATAGTILRKMVALEQQEVDGIFGERAFDIQDLFQKEDGKGVITLLNISDIQSQPILFSTFLLSLLAQLFKKLPEVGDLDQPKLVFFFEEAHLLFKDAPKAFLTQIEQIVRLIRSKGVGVFFCTQAASDIPESVLGQLGNRIQHALRAFTPNDAEALRKTVKTYPHSDFYALEKVLTSLGTGQALITVLNDKGIPTEVVATHLIPPRAHMGPLGSTAYDAVVNQSDLHLKYAEEIHRPGAAEMVQQKMEQFAAQQAAEESRKEPTNSRTSRSKTTGRSTSSRQTPLEAAQKAATTTLAREGVKLLGKIANGLLGAMFRKK
jgi:DNA helicase HerA-like ATPase